MRKVTGGNTLDDLAVGVGDVVYFNDPKFDKRGRDRLISEVVEHARHPKRYYCDENGEQVELDGQSPYWHVVSYSMHSQAMIDEVVATPGVQGYSSPTPDHVVFSMSDPMYDLVCTSQAWTDLVAEHMEFGHGSWKGIEEISLCLPKSVFDEMQRRWPFLLHDQDAVLLLGTPEAQNWRPAELLWLKYGEREQLGTWLEVTEEVARAQESWSSFNSRYYAVLVDPPEDAETAKERLVEEKLKLLDSVMARICAMTKQDMHKFGLYHDWATWATIDKRMW